MRHPVHALRDADSVEGSRKRPEFLVRAAAAALAEEHAVVHLVPSTSTAPSSLPDASPLPSAPRVSLAGVALECVDLILAYQQEVAAKYARFGWGGGSRGLRAANRLPNLFLEDLKRWCLDELTSEADTRAASTTSPRGEARFEHTSSANQPASSTATATGPNGSNSVESALALGSGEAAALRGVHYLGLVLYGDDDDYSSDRGSEGGDIHHNLGRSAKDPGSFAWCFQGEHVPILPPPPSPPVRNASTEPKNSFACADCRLGNSGNKYNKGGSSSTRRPSYNISSSISSGKDTGRRKTTNSGSPDLGSLLVAVRGALAAGVSQRLRRRLDQTALRPQLEELQGHAEQCFKDSRRCLAFLLLVGTKKTAPKQEGSAAESTTPVHGQGQRSSSVDDTSPIDSLMSNLFNSSTSKENELGSGINSHSLPSSDDEANLLATLLDGSSVARGSLDMRLGFAVQGATSLLEPRDRHHLDHRRSTTISGYIGSGGSGSKLRCADVPDVFAAALGAGGIEMAGVVPPAMLVALTELTETWADHRDGTGGNEKEDRSPPPSPLSPMYPSGSGTVVEERTSMKGASSNESLQSLEGSSPSSSFSSSAGKRKQADTLALRAYSLLQRTALLVGWLEEALAATAPPISSSRDTKEGSAASPAAAAALAAAAAAPQISPSLTLADVRDELTTISAALSGTLPALRHELKALYKIAASMNRRRNYAWHLHMPSAMAALGQVGHHVAAAAGSCVHVGSCLAALAATELALGLDGALVDAGRSEFLAGDVDPHTEDGSEEEAKRSQEAAAEGNANASGSSSDDDDGDDACQREAAPGVVPPEPWEVVESQSQQGTYYFRNKDSQFTTWSLPDWDIPHAPSAWSPKRSRGSRKAVLSLRRRMAEHAELF